MFTAVFIDWENIEKTAKQNFGSIFAYDKFVEVIKKVAGNNGHLICGIFAYGDFDKGEAGLQTRLIQLGIEPKHVVTKTAHEYLKGSTDIELSLDILTVMYEYPHIDDYLFISGDGDLRHVIRRLQMRGKTLRLMGFRDHTNRYLTELVNDIIFLDDYPEIMRKVTKTEKEKKMLSFLADEFVKRVVLQLHWAEKNLEKQFIGLNYFRNRLLVRYPKTEISEALTNALDYNLITTYHVDNPDDPLHPTKACRLNRENIVVQQILDEAGSKIDD
ncbi:MAG: NYN domain-containing protein [Bacillota bacterium]